MTLVPDWLSIQIRVFELLTGKLFRVYDESLDVYAQNQQVRALFPPRRNNFHAACWTHCLFQDFPFIPAMEFGRRVAAERDLQKSLAIRRESAGIAIASCQKSDFNSV